MEYSIGDVARTLGLTTVALHYFEREGVISPLAETGKRRLYRSEDIIRLISSRKYRSMELPIKEIAGQFSPDGNTLCEIRDKLARQGEQMRQRREHYQMLEDEIGWYKAALDRALRQGSAIDIQPSPECYSLCFPPDGFISRRKQEQSHIAAWLEQLPLTHLSVLAASATDAIFGYSVDASRCRQLNLHQLPEARLRPSIPSLHTFVDLPYEYYDHPEMAFSGLYRYAENHCLEVCGGGIGIHLAVACREDRRDTAVELWLPVNFK